MSETPFNLPSTNRRDEQLNLSRRELFRIAAAIPLAGLVNPLQASASQPVESQLAEPWLTVDAVQIHLFPETENGVSAKQIQGLFYLQQKFERPLADLSDRDFLFQGVGWLNDFALSGYQKPFIDLKSSDKEALLQQIAQSQAGENWLALIINNLIEAMLTDPVYGGNPNGIGWKASGQIPGYPLPKPSQRYYELGYQKRQRQYRRRDEIWRTKA